LKAAIYSGTIPATTFIERLIRELAEKDVEILLHGKLTQPIRYNSKNIKVIGFTGKFSKSWVIFKYAVLLFLAGPSQFRRLQKCIQKKTSLPFSHCFCIVAPLIWHKTEIFHLQWAKAIEDFIFLQEFGIKVVLSLRGTHIHYSPIINTDLADSYIRVFPSVDAFHGVSKAICAEAEKYGADLDKCKVVYSGLNLSEFIFQEKKTFNRKRIKIISVGRAHWIKGYNFALDAMKIFRARGKEFDYTIIGGQDEELIYQVADLNLEDFVKLEEKIPFEKVKSLVSTADILLLSSVEEGIPNVVLEAMALGTIVVSTNCGGVSEIIEDGKNGFLVPIRSPQAIAAKIETLLNISDAKLNAVRKNARETIEKQHNHQKMVEGMLALYTSIK
jgi:glycosyltransferase involved in cell wall biosynthesis